jgi:GT2 family glycosyltransferase/glycosyltransferase involved in cell wall biosynthesis
VGDVSVVVVLHQSAEHVAACLRELPPAVETIVVDNGSTDDGAAVAARAKPGATILRQPNLGFAAGCNAGAARASRRWLLFLNPDAVLAPDALSRLVQRAQTMPGWVVGPAVRDGAGRLVHNCRREGRPAHDIASLLPFGARLVPQSRSINLPAQHRVYRCGGPVAWVQGACMLVARDAFWDVGGFDEQYFLYAEEETLAARLRVRGGGCWYAPEASTRHIGGASTRQRGTFALRQYWRSRTIVYRKRYGEWGGRAAGLGMIGAAVVGLAAHLGSRVFGCDWFRGSRPGAVIATIGGVLRGLTVVVVPDPAVRSDRLGSGRVPRVATAEPPPISRRLRMRRRPRILIVADWFVRLAVAHAIALDRAGADVRLRVVTNPDEFGGDASAHAGWLDQARAAGIRVTEIQPGLKRPGAAWDCAQGIISALWWRPVVVHAHHNGDLRLLAAACAGRVAYVIHDPVPHPGQVRYRLLSRAVVRGWIRHASILCVHGEHLRGELATVLPGRRIEVIPHGASVRAEPLPKPVAPQVLFFGRLEPYKGLAVLLEAMELLWGRGITVGLIVAGRGPEASAVPRHPRIEHIGHFIDETEVDRLFERATVVVLPYIQGSQSGVGLLAVARGVPVVASDVGSLSELVHHTSMLVEPGDPVGLANALTAALNHGEGERSKVLEHARRHFAWDVVARTTLQAYARNSMLPREWR